MSTTEQDKSHMMQDQMSINCPNLLGWKVSVFLTLRAVRLISYVWSAKRREPSPLAKMQVDPWGGCQHQYFQPHVPALVVLFRPANFSSYVMMTVKTVSLHQCTLHSCEKSMWEAVTESLLVWMQSSIFTSRLIYTTSLRTTFQRPVCWRRRLCFHSSLQHLTVSQRRAPGLSRLL